MVWRRQNMSNIKLSPAALEKMKKSDQPYMVYLAYRGGWGSSSVVPAVKAGTPAEENGYTKKEVEGITIYVPGDLEHKHFEIGYVGFWIFGQYTVKILELAWLVLILVECWLSEKNRDRLFSVPVSFFY